MNIGRLEVSLAGPDPVAGVVVYLATVPERNSTFVYRHQPYRVVDVVHGVEVEGGDYLQSIKLELDYLP